MVEGRSGTVSALVELPAAEAVTADEGAVEATELVTPLAPPPARSQGLGGARTADIRKQRLSGYTTIDG